MSKKWRSSQKVSVDGNSFKRARLAFKNTDEDLTRGTYGSGSQEWLAEEAKVSPRTVFELEAGNATVKTVDAVSNVLKIMGRKFILGYGADFTKFHVASAVDFRPLISGRLPGNENAYLDEDFLITLIPLIVTLDDDFIDSSEIKNMQIVLQVGDMEIPFTWLYKVGLNSRATTWLGDEEEIGRAIVEKNNPYRESIMFKQSLIQTVSWHKFINQINETNDNRILLKLKITFDNFELQDHIMISVEELKGLFGVSYPLGYPYWVQPKALMIDRYP